MSEPAEEKIARLTRERDEMATQAAACAEEVDRVRAEIGAVQAEIERLQIIIRDREWKRDLAEQEVAQLTTALAESERKGVEALGLKESLPEGVTFEVSYVAQDRSFHHSVRNAVERNESIVRTQAATNLLAAGASVWEAARAWSPFPDPKLPEVLKLITKDTPLIISHWQCRDEPGYKICRFEEGGYYVFVGGMLAVGQGRMAARYR